MPHLVHRIASAPAGLRWDPTYTIDFYVYEFDPALMALARQTYRVARKAGASASIARLLAILSTNKRPFHWVPNNQDRASFGRWQR